MGYNYRVRGVAQLGESARFGSVRSAVQVRPPRLSLDKEEGNLLQ